MERRYKINAAPIAISVALPLRSTHHTALLRARRRMQ
jgi:hypothetical protein